MADTSATALRLAEARYRQGVDGYLRYLDSQRNSFADRLDVIDVMTQHQISIVRLFKALGGGWEDQTLASAESFEP